MTDPRKAKADAEAACRFHLDQYIPYLLNRVGMQIAFDISKDIRHSRLKYSHLRVLLALFHYSSMRIIDIATLSVFEISTLSRVVADLERKQLVHRLKNDGKGRIRKIALTTKGEEMVQRLLPIAFSHEKSAIACLSSGERLLLIELLHRMRDSISRGDNG